MDKQLLSVIHKFAEDREIGWIEAKTVGEQYGMKFKSEDDLREWKQTIDNYLGTFREEDFYKIEEACKGKKDKKRKKKVTNEAVTDPTRGRTTSPHRKSEKAQRTSKTAMTKERAKSLYTKAQLARLKKHYNVDSNEKALERAIRDKQRGVDPLKKVKSSPRMASKVQESRKRRRQSD